MMEEIAAKFIRLRWNLNIVLARNISSILFKRKTDEKDKIAKKKQQTEKNNRKIPPNNLFCRWYLFLSLRNNCRKYNVEQWKLEFIYWSNKKKQQRRRRRWLRHRRRQQSAPIALKQTRNKIRVHYDLIGADVKL